MTSIVDIAIQARSLHEALIEFIEQTMARQDEISVEKLIRMAYKQFETDEWVREALIREGLNTLIPTLAAEVRHTHRSRARRTTSPGERRRQRIASVFEHVGSGVSKSVLAMNRKEHLFAAEERETAAAGQLRWAGFHRAVVKLHSDDTTTTGQLPPAKVAQLWKEHIETETS